MGDGRPDDAGAARAGSSLDEAAGSFISFGETPPDSAGQFASISASSIPGSDAQFRLAESPGVPTGLIKEETSRYEPRGEQGRGGIGRVLVVFDSAMGREVALKELLPGLTGRSSLAAAQARFLHEARITSQLEHPGIVPVHELGQRADGAIYYTMKLVRGDTLATRLLAARNLRERLALLPHFVDVCQAIAYAHSRGVIHRDLKPANVMVGQFGETVLLDWGLAKVRGQADVDADRLAGDMEKFKAAGAGQSVVGSPIGTPSYMPPEQADGRIADIDERSDVWSLGAILYELLTGQPPYTGGSAYDVISRVLSEEVVHAAQRAPDIPPDLAAIAMRCLRKEPAARYPSVADLAADVEAFQTGKLVSAFSYSARDLVLRWARRRWPALATAAVALVVLLAVAAFSYRDVLVQRNLALAANARLDRRNSELLGLRLAQTSLKQLELGNSERAALLALQGAAYHSRFSDWMPEVTQALRAVADCDSFAIVLGPYESGDYQRSAAFLDGGRRLAAADNSGPVRIWDLQHAAAPPLELPQAGGQVAVSPDGKWLASQIKEADLEAMGCALLLWATDAFDAEPQRLPGLMTIATAIAFSPDGRWLAAGDAGGRTMLWSADALDTAPLELPGHTTAIHKLAFSPDGGTLAAGSGDRTASIWDLRCSPPKLVTVLKGHTNQLYGAAFSPDGNSLYTCGRDGTLRVWETHRWGKNPRVIQVTGEEAADLVMCVAVSPDGRTLAVATHNDKLIRLWPTHDLAAQPRILRGHQNGIWSICFSPDGERLASASDDGTVRIWRLGRSSDSLRSLTTPGRAPAESLAVSPDGRWLAAGCNFGAGLFRWDLTQLELPPTPLPGHRIAPGTLAVSPDGMNLASVSGDKTMLLWEMRFPQPTPRRLWEHSAPLNCVAFSPDGSWLAASGGTYINSVAEKSVRLWKTSDFEAPPELLAGRNGCMNTCLVFAGTNKLLASAIDARDVYEWNLDPLQTEGHVLLNCPDNSPWLGFSPRHGLATGSLDGHLRLWDLADVSQPRLELRGHLGWVMDHAFSEPLSLLASASLDGTVRLWNLAEPDRPPEVILSQERPTSDLFISADGATLVTADYEGRILFWPVDPGSVKDAVAQMPQRNLSQDEWTTFIGKDIPYERTIAALPPGRDAPLGD